MLILVKTSKIVFQKINKHIFSALKIKINVYEKIWGLLVIILIEIKHLGKVDKKILFCTLYALCCICNALQHPESA